MKDLYEASICILLGLAIAATIYLAVVTAEQRRQNAVLSSENEAILSELHQARIMAEWDKFEEGRAK
jgi:Tfp pilus assembly protein PilN